MKMTLLTAAVLSLAGNQIIAQTNPVIFKNGFEDGKAGWNAFGLNATDAKLSTSPENVHSGKQSLQVDYQLKKGTLSSLTLPTSDKLLANVKAFSFWIKADYSAPMVIVLQEQGAGRYMSMFSASAGQWQHVEVAVSDFLLAEEADAPKDPDGKLDMDQVESIQIADAAQFFAQGDEKTAVLLGAKLGPHSMWLDDFEARSTSLPLLAPAAAGAVRIEPFSRPQLPWLSIGTGAISTPMTSPITGKSMQWSYSQSPTGISGLMRPFKKGLLSGMDKITFMIASEQSAKLMVQVEDNDNRKYSMMIETPGGKTPKEFVVRFVDMNQSDDSADKGKKLDLDKISKVVVIDISGMVDQVNRNNTLWFGPITANGK